LSSRSHTDMMRLYWLAQRTAIRTSSTRAIADLTRSTYVAGTCMKYQVYTGHPEYARAMSVRSMRVPLCRRVDIASTTR
jgi:hypothetical protein